LQTLSYSVVSGGSGYSAPIFQANQCGVAVPATLTNTATGCWYDCGSSWSVSPNLLTGSTTSERWRTTQATPGIITAVATRVFTYTHQFYLTMIVNPTSAESVTPSSGWHVMYAVYSFFANCFLCPCHVLCLLNLLIAFPAATLVSWFRFLVITMTIFEDAVRWCAHTH
jgi:hypothetical protein